MRLLCKVDVEWDCLKIIRYLYGFIRYMFKFIFKDYCKYLGAVVYICNISMWGDGL